RKPNFTPVECAVIFEQVEENIKITNSKFSTTLSNKNKSQVWELITEKANAPGVAKKNYHGKNSKRSTARKKTRGGKKPDALKATTGKIVEPFETDPSFSGILGGIDSVNAW
ncbi:unnamed protein product, partial [Pocillopora meandrina]